MYSAFIGMRCALVLFSNAAFKGIFRVQVFGSAGIDRFCHLMVRQQTWQESQTPISRCRWAADVGIASAISKPGARARRHMQVIRVRALVVLTAGDKPLL